MRAQRLRELISETPDTFLRIGVDAGGCSGFQYTFELDTALEPDDMCAPHPPP